MNITITKPLLDAREQELVAEVIASGWVTQGPRVGEFEKAFAAYVGAPHAVAVTSCTTALHLSLVALDVGPGDEVLVPDFTFPATANVVEGAQDAVVAAACPVRGGSGLYVWMLTRARPPLGRRVLLLRRVWISCSLNGRSKTHSSS